MALEYRAWQEGDDLELIQLWGGPESATSEQFRGSFRPPAEEPWNRCITVVDQGVPVAAGCVYGAALHPDRLWCYIEVAADHRRTGVGSTLLTMLQHEAAASPSGITALRSKVTPGTTGAAFAQATGFGALQRSRLVVIGPGALAAPALDDAAGPQLEEAATGSVELTRALTAFYESVHVWDRAELSLGRAQQLFLGDASGAGGAIVLRDRPKADGGAIATFAVSYTQARTDDPADVLLGYDTSLPPAEQQAAVATMIAMLVHQYPIQLEVDDAMEALVAVVEPLLATGAAQLAGPETLVVATA
ncbi:GNAT family N-acetyltransferase [Arthrobacter bussei]|uniref:GNAT family N-acetyltransferase n=1 Tax=Arthrobacter bussei TaxID=2594179 RepID=A0A7X1TPP2_9MICC|nr:GNAT family N-acetyltransferase [Arthrobacter bussei]MPY11771.1 GNAT family N-acetyltransferase [Arthrobacter bussei]